MRVEQIGRATLYLARCEDVLSALARADAVVSDPPYGIGFQHGGGGVWGNSGLTGKNAPKTFTGRIIGDDEPFDPAPLLSLAPKVLLWGADHFRQQLPQGGTMLAWDKSCGVGPHDSCIDCEFAWTNTTWKRNVFRLLWKGLLREGEDRKAADRRRFHVSQKPRELMRWCLEGLRLRPGHTVLDPYMGSGSTGVAAVGLGLEFVGIECDPNHFATACRRIAAAQPELAGTGGETAGIAALAA